jgi:hypothetical protein
MATLASGLSARLWPSGTYTRWIPSRSFTVSSSVPPLPDFSQRDDNVGGVKNFSSTLQHALGEERHFALVEAVAFALPTQARS